MRSILLIINNFFRKLASAVLSSAVAVSGIAGGLHASANDTSALLADYYAIEPVDTGIPSYSEYFDTFSGESFASAEVSFKGSDYSHSDGDITVGKFGTDDDMRDGMLIWNGNSGSVTYDISFPETGLYCLGINYLPFVSNCSHIELSMEIDGKIPYDTASRLTLNRVWVNEADIYVDSRGNQVRPSQVQTSLWQECSFGDIDGLFGEPLFFFIEKGTHEITFSSERADFAVDTFRFFAPDELPDYDQYRNSITADTSSQPSDIFRIEGENAVYKSDSTLYPTYDNTSYIVYPSDPRKVVYNTLGAGNWKKALQSVTWVIPKENIPADGWYKIGIRSRQDMMRGFYSNRRIRIDGEVPCKELDQVRFFYDNDWNVVSPQTDSGEDVYVFLTAGSDHTFTMECVPGEIGDSLRKLDGVVADLNKYYRKVLMITGPSPDQYTDYYVHEKIPELVGNFRRLSQELKDIQSEIEKLSGTSGSEASALENMAVILDKCTEKPLRIPSYLQQIKDSIASVSAWMRDYRDQPLEVDFIEFASPDREFTGCKEKLGKSLAFSADAFIGSFFEDYTTLSDVTGEDAIDVWVALGRDQAQVVKEMTENEFMQKYNIPVSVNLVVGGVVEATLAGKGPDAALFLGGEFPVNLAARDLTADLSGFSDFEQVSTRFQENALTPYQYNGGTFGLPISQNFPMMFYRTDVLTELGFTSPPETWSELIDMLPALQRNYMSVGLILPPANISPATETGHTFAMLMLQKGLNYYNDDLSASVFDSTEAVQSFEEWTDFYTKYSFVQSYDAFSRFRTGEYPVVISNYTFFNQLTEASPEIKGLWDFCPVPGTEREDGSVSHAANSNGAGAVIFNKCKNKDGAWEFIKWFTDTDTQVRYGTQIEGLLGTMGRFDTANVDALKQLSWSEKEYSRLYAQQSELAEIPIIPSSYAVTRNIMNAFRETVNEGENPRDTLIWYNRDINDEIARKRTQIADNRN